MSHTEAHEIENKTRPLHILSSVPGYDHWIHVNFLKPHYFNSVAQMQVRYNGKILFQRYL